MEQPANAGGKGLTPKEKTIGIGADELGMPLKEHITGLLRQRGYEVLDYSGASARDYPDVASDAAEAVGRGECSRAILFCGTGLGMAIVANKFFGVRAVTAHNTLSAERARKSNDAQILTMGAMVITPSAAETVVEHWLAAEFDGGRSRRKVEKVNQIDSLHRLPPQRSGEYQRERATQPGQARPDALHRIGAVGLWTRQFNFFPTSRVRGAVRNLEALGYGAVWVGETTYREPLTHAAVLLGATNRMVVATGIASMWARDPFATTAAQLTLADAYPGRFVLGIGVSHPSLVDKTRQTRYKFPLATLRNYLDAMDRAADTYGAVAPPTAPRLLAALGPRMLELAATRSQGALTYLVSPEHTHTARAILGPAATLCVEQALVLDRAPSTARAVARKHLIRYLGMPNYVNNWRRLGFTDEDLVDGGSDRLVDALVSWGDPATATARIRDHLDAGADHVCVQIYHADPEHLPEDDWRQVAQTLDLNPG